LLRKDYYRHSTVIPLRSTPELLGLTFQKFRSHNLFIQAPQVQVARL